MTQSLVPRLLTAEEVGLETGLSVWRLYELVRSNEIPHVRVGRSVRFIAQDIAGWLSAGGTRPHGK